MYDLLSLTGWDLQLFKQEENNTKLPKGTV